MSVNLVPFGLSRYGPVLSTREMGIRIARDLQRETRNAAGVVVGFWGVEVATPAVLDELVLALRGWVASTAPGERTIVAVGYNDDVKESLHLVLERRKMALAALEDDQVKLLGGTRQLQATMKVAQELHAFDAPALAERLAVKLPNLHQRLQALMDAGAIAREPDEAATRGRKHKYKVVDRDDVASLNPA